MSQSRHSSQAQGGGEQAHRPPEGGSHVLSLWPPTHSFSVRFKEGRVTVKVIQGSSGPGKLSCRKKGSQCLEVTVS